MALDSSQLEMAHNMGQEDYARHYKKYAKPVFGPNWIALYMAAGLGQSREDWEEFSEAYEAGWKHAEAQFEENERNGVYDDPPEGDDDEDEDEDEDSGTYGSSSSDSSYSDSDGLAGALIGSLIVIGILIWMVVGVVSCTIHGVRDIGHSIEQAASSFAPAETSASSPGPSPAATAQPQAPTQNEAPQQQTEAPAQNEAQENESGGMTPAPPSSSQATQTTNEDPPY